MNLPEGWFVTEDSVHYPVFKEITLRHIRIQNGTTPGSRAVIFSCALQDFSYEKAETSLRKYIKEENWNEV